MNEGLFTEVHIKLLTWSYWCKSRQIKRWLGSSSKDKAGCLQPIHECGGTAGSSIPYEVDLRLGLHNYCFIAW